MVGSHAVYCVVICNSSEKSYFKTGYSCRHATIITNLLHALSVYKNNFIRTTRLKFAPKNKNKLRTIEARLQIQM